MATLIDNTKPNWRPAGLPHMGTYDMVARPENGDAMDHLGPYLGIVIALHLYGIDKSQSPGPTLQEKLTGDSRVYCRENVYLLTRCMELAVPLLCWGDQPWYGARNSLDLTTLYKTKMTETWVGSVAHRTGFILHLRRLFEWRDTKPIINPDAPGFKVDPALPGSSMQALKELLGMPREGKTL